jgi:hypothetical protein
VLAAPVSLSVLLAPYLAGFAHADCHGAAAVSANMRNAICRSRSFTIDALFALVEADSTLPLPNNKRLADHPLPLLFLRVAQEGLDLFLAIQAKLDDFGQDLLRLSGGLGLFH